MGPSVPEGGCRGKRGWRRGRYAGVYALERPQGANGRPGEISKCTCTGTCTDISPLAEAKAARALVQEASEHRFRGTRDQHHLDRHQDATFLVGSPSRTCRRCGGGVRPLRPWFREGGGLERWP